MFDLKLPGGASNLTSAMNEMKQNASVASGQFGQTTGSLSSSASAGIGKLTSSSMFDGVSGTFTKMGGEAAAAFGGAKAIFNGTPSAGAIGQCTAADLLPAAQASAASVPGDGFYGGVGKMVGDAAAGVAGMVSSIFGGTNTVGFGETTGDTMKMRVTLTSSRWSFENVIFKVQPTFSDSRTADYGTTNILHHPGQMAVYKTTQLREITLSFVFFSRNEQEAAETHRYVRLIRSWVMPHYGQTRYDLGAPPNILYLSGLGTILGNYGYAGEVGRIPVVVKSYQFDFNDASTDYISTGVGNGDNDWQPMPIVLKGTITLMEAYSPEEMMRFDLGEFARGKELYKDRSYLSKTNSAGARAPATGTGGIISKPTDPFGALKNAVGGAVNSVTSAISGVVNGIQSMAKGALSNVSDAKQARMCSISDVTSGLQSKIPSFNSESVRAPSVKNLWDR